MVLKKCGRTGGCDRPIKQERRHGRGCEGTKEKDLRKAEQLSESREIAAIKKRREEAKGLRRSLRRLLRILLGWTHKGARNTEVLVIRDFII